MATFTTRLNATKPASSENVDISVLNTNSDLFDAAVGSTVASAASRPASTWQGRVWYAQDTDKFYVNEAASASAVAVWAEPVAQALAGNVVVGGTLGVAGTLTASGALNVTGALAANGGLSVTGIGQRTLKKKAAAQSRVSSTTMVDDADLVFTLVAGAVYFLRSFLDVTGAAAGDVKVGWVITGAASATAIGGRYGIGPQIATADSTATSMRHTRHGWTSAIPYGLDGSAASHIEEGGLLDCSGGSGTIQMQFAQNTSNAASTQLSANCWAILERFS
jgi:hypothetical protein